MRLRLEVFVPIVLLSILVQLFAPIAAFRVVAYAVTDPLYMASICTGMVSSPDAQPAPAKTPHDHGDCCVFCAAGHGGAIAIEPPPLVFVSLQRQYQHVAWLEAADPMSAGRVGSNAQARAPPQLM
jgi:general stress protein CsbA